MSLFANVLVQGLSCFPSPQLFTVREAQLCFLYSRMVYADLNNPDSTQLYFTDFLEALCRMSDVKLIPLDALQGATDMLRWSVSTSAETKGL